MKIKLSQPTPRKPKWTIITPKVSLITLEEIRIMLDVTHVMRKVTYPNTSLTKGTQRRRRETREDIMLMLQRMMNLPQRESDKKVILQVMKNMYRSPFSWDLFHMEEMIGS